MPKVKLSIKELDRLSLILDKELKAKKTTLNNMQNQEFQSEERKKALIKLQSYDFEFVNAIKEKFDIETFGRNG